MKNPLMCMSVLLHIPFSTFIMFWVLSFLNCKQLKYQHSVNSGEDVRGWVTRWWFQHSCKYASGCLWHGKWLALWLLWAESRSYRGGPCCAPQSDCLLATSVNSGKRKPAENRKRCFVIGISKATSKFLVFFSKCTHALC